MRSIGSAPAVGHLHPIADEEFVDGPARRLVLRQGLAEQTSDLRLCKAANRILRGLENPRITTVRSVDRDTQGRLVLTYDAESRVPLSQRLSDSPRFVVHVLLELCEALDAAHSLGVIHGALTPDAVRLTADLDTPSVSLADFGLGHLFGPKSKLHERPRWLPYSPEKQLGLDPTPAEDVYLLGSLGFTMITGRPLFESPTREQLLRQHAIESATHVLDGQLACEPWLAEVLARCLHKEPEERFPNPADLARALRDRPEVSRASAAHPPEVSPPLESIEGIDEEEQSRPLPSEEPVKAEPLVPVPLTDPATQTLPARRGFPFGVAAVVAAVAALGTWAVWSVGSNASPATGATPVSASPRSGTPAPRPSDPSASRPDVVSANIASDTAEGSPATSPDTAEGSPTPSPEQPGVVAEANPNPDEPDRTAEAIRLTKGARAAQKSGNGAKAVRLYQRALAVRSEHAVAAYELGELYFDQGDVAAAIRSARQATGSAPRNGTYRLALGDYYSESGNDTAAHKHWKRAANLGSKVARQRLPSG